MTDTEISPLLTEDKLQMQIMDWVRLVPELDKHLLHIPNGGFRNAREGAKFKRMGVKAGVSDLFLAKPSKTRHGLWVELKSERGVLTPNQKNWLALMQANGYEAVVCRSFDEFLEVIKGYVNE